MATRPSDPIQPPERDGADLVDRFLREFGDRIGRVDGPMSVGLRKACNPFPQPEPHGRWGGSSNDTLAMLLMAVYGGAIGAGLMWMALR